MRHSPSIPSVFTNANFAMVFAMLLIGTANILWAERLTVNGGFGWDGLWYSAWVKDFYGNIFVRGVPEYYAQRILPSAIVHYGMRMFGVPLSDRNIILAFDIYDLLLLLLSVYLWGRIADKLAIRNQGKWLGFCFLFLNYAILKNNFYHSVLTDTSAFTLGLLMFYFFLTDRALGMLAVIFAGAFTWPTVPPMAALLYIVPYTPKENHTSRPAVPKHKLHIVFASAVCAAVALIYAYLLQPQRLATRLSQFGLVLRIDLPLLYVSVAAVIVYLFFSLRTAMADQGLFNLRRLRHAIKWKRAVVAIGSLVLLKVAITSLASDEAFGWGFKPFIIHTFLSPLTEPFIFFVAHVIYYGPAILLLAFLWGPFCRSVGTFGLGMKLFVILNVILSINPQSRYQINAVTAFIILLVRLLDRASLGYKSVGLWAVLCLLYSKVWYIFNTGPQDDFETMEALLRFPLQHYFMNSGPWMSHDMYLVQGSIVLLTALVLHFLTRNYRRRIKAVRAE